MVGPVGRVAVLQISIHAPREGSDAAANAAGSEHNKFLSTLPVRGATLDKWPKETTIWISIHAPREGSDNGFVGSSGSKSSFLSTLPVRGATHPGAAAPWLAIISIHAPREGSDGCQDRRCMVDRQYFYPRSP